jgi:hypothetical protein
MKNKIERLKVKETKLVSKGKKAVDEGRMNKADRLLGRAAKVENRIIEKTGEVYPSKMAKAKHEKSESKKEMIKEYGMKAALKKMKK